MKTRGVIGKRIVAVEQERGWDDASGKMEPYVHVHAIVLEDGTRITTNVVELTSEYAVEMTAHAPAKRRKEGGT